MNKSLELLQEATRDLLLRIDEYNDALKCVQSAVETHRTVIAHFMDDGKYAYSS